MPTSICFKIDIKQGDHYVDIHDTHRTFLGFLFMGNSRKNKIFSGAAV